MFTGSVSTPRSITTQKTWVTIFGGDKQAADGSQPGALIQMTHAGVAHRGAFGFPQRDGTDTVPHVAAKLYVNVSGDLMDGYSGGIFDIRAVRLGTNNDTSVKDHPFRGNSTGGSFQCYHDHPVWIGANPKGFVWQIRLRQGIARLDLGVRYVKHYGMRLIP